MYCGKCGMRVDDTTGLCPNCSKSSRVKRKKTWAVISIVVLSAVILGTGLWIYKKYTVFSLADEATEKANVEDDFIRGEHVLWTYIEGETRMDDSETMRIVLDEKVLDTKMNGNAQKICHSLKGDVWCVLAGDSTLYSVVGETVTEIAQNVTECVLSADGEGLAYTNEKDTLTLYSVVTEEKTEIAHNVDKTSGFVISPDGQTVAYVAPDDLTVKSTKNSDSLAMYAFSNGEITKIGTNQMPIGISNSGSQIYYIVSPSKTLSGSIRLYVGNLRGSTKLLAESQRELYDFHFNADQTQLMFLLDGNCYLCIDGKEVMQLTTGGTLNDCLGLIIPSGSSRSCIKSWNRFGGVIFYSIYPIKNFAGHFYEEYGDNQRLFYLDKNLKWFDLANGQPTGSAVLSDDGSTLMYVLKTDSSNLYNDSGDLYRVNCEKVSQSILLAENVRYGRTSSDGGAAYYIDQNNTLWYKKGVDVPKHIADNIDFCNMSHDGYAMFGTLEFWHAENTEGTLYCSKDGGDKQVLISGLSDALYTYPTVTTAHANYDTESDTYEIYAVKDGVYFQKIVENAKYYVDWHLGLIDD